MKTRNNILLVTVQLWYLSLLYLVTDFCLQQRAVNALSQKKKTIRIQSTQHRTFVKKNASRGLPTTGFLLQVYGMHKPTNPGLLVKKYQRSESARSVIAVNISPITAGKHSRQQNPGKMTKFLWQVQLATQGLFISHGEHVLYQTACICFPDRIKSALY